MSEEQYFVISNGSGDTTVSMWSKQNLLKALEDEYWGDNGVLTPEAFAAGRADTNYWGGRILIIKGSVARVTPPGDWRVE